MLLSSVCNNNNTYARAIYNNNNTKGDGGVMVCDGGVMVVCGGVCVCVCVRYHATPQHEYNRQSRVRPILCLMVMVGQR